MKLRAGFVSNSSSSSFIITGFQLDHERKLSLMKDGSKGEFDFVTNDNDGTTFVGYRSFFEESFYGTESLDPTFTLSRPQVKAASDRFGFDLKEARIYVGTFDN